MQLYDFPAFLRRITPLSLGEMFIEADNECARAERDGVGRGSRARREQGCVGHAASVRAFMYWLQYRKKPGTDADFPLFRPVAVALIERGELEPDALKLFDR